MLLWHHPGMVTWNTVQNISSLNNNNNKKIKATFRDAKQCCPIFPWKQRWKWQSPRSLGWDSCLPKRLAGIFPWPNKQANLPSGLLFLFCCVLLAFLKMYAVTKGPRFSFVEPLWVFTTPAGQDYFPQCCLERLISEEFPGGPKKKKRLA